MMERRNPLRGQPFIAGAIPTLQGHSHEARATFEIQSFLSRMAEGIENMLAGIGLSRLDIETSHIFDAS
jgi:hypothetical protein